MVPQENQKADSIMPMTLIESLIFFSFSVHKLTKSVLTKLVINMGNKMGSMRFLETGLAGISFNGSIWTFQLSKLGMDQLDDSGKEPSRRQNFNAASSTIACSDKNPLLKKAFP